TAPGTVTESQPRIGGWSGLKPYFFRKYSTLHAAGARPEAFRPCNFLPSHRMQKASDPRPLLQGSRIVMAAAAPMAASTALPPRCSSARPTWAARGCDVDTTLRAKTGNRTEGYPARQSKFTARPA